MAFFDSGGPHGLCPVAEIDHVELGWTSRTGEHNPAFVIMKSGRKIEVEDAVVDQIVKLQATVIPAQNGCNLLTFCYFPELPDPGPWFEKDAVLAWRASIHGALEPMVVREGFERMGSEHAILHADGRVDTRDQNYDSVDRWMTEMKGAVDAINALVVRKNETVQ